jgi:hypothetical protein
MTALFPISQSKSKIGDMKQARAGELALVDIHDGNLPNFANLSASQPPEASRLTANLSNGLPSRVLGHLSMREAMSRFSSKFSAVCLFSPTVCLFSGWHKQGEQRIRKLNPTIRWKWKTRDVAAFFFSHPLIPEVNGHG